MILTSRTPLPNSPTELLDCIKFLRGAAPEHFTRFREAFARYADDVRLKLVNADSKLEVLQGQAQQCEKILQLLTDGERRG